MKYIFFFLLFFFSLYAKQNDFSLIIDKKFNGILYDVIEDYAHNLVAVGYVKIYNQRYLTQSYDSGFDYLEQLSRNNGTYIFFVKINQDGKVILKKQILDRHFNKAVSIQRNLDGNYYIGGYTLSGRLIVQKMSFSGNNIFTKIFGTKNYNKLSRIIALGDGGVLAIASSVATREKSRDIFQTGLANDDCYLVRFDKNGHQVWSKKYGTLDDDFGVDGIEMDDGSFIVVFNTKKRNNSKVTIMHLTQQGDKIWKEDVNSTLKIQAYKLLKLRDESIVLSLNQIDDMGKKQIRLIQFDQYANILNDKEIDTTYGSVLQDIKEFSDGMIVGVGYVEDGFDTDGLVMLFDKKLNLLNQEHYGKDNYDAFYGVALTNDGKISVVGTSSFKNLQGSNMWIMKLNRHLQ